MVSTTSRYAGLGTSTWTGPDGRVYPYIPRRFLPDPASAVAIGVYDVTRGDRLDNITAAYLGDPELFWRLCDANNAMAPEDLEEVGRRLTIPLPQRG
jgi:nucleoid-associated protein YgaU